MHYLTRRPTQELDGYLDVAGGSFNELKLEGAIGGGLGKSAGRLSAARHKHDGYTKNRVGPDYNETDAIALRGQFAFEPSDGFDGLFNAYYSDNDAAVGAWQHQATKLDANGESVPLGPTEQTIPWTAWPMAYPTPRTSALRRGRTASATGTRTATPMPGTTTATGASRWEPSGHH